MATVEELEEQIFDTITSLRNSKKQPNEDTTYYTISKTKTTKSLNKETLREVLNKLVSSKKLKVKLHNGKIRTTQKMIPSTKTKINIKKLKMLKTCSHLIMKLSYRKMTLKHQKGEPL